MAASVCIQVSDCVRACVYVCVYVLKGVKGETAVVKYLAVT